MEASVVDAVPMQLLKVIDRLVVGPTRLERRRIVCPYTVHQQGQSDTFEFVYRFEEDVFGTDAESSSSHEEANLAAMMTAQIALNYSLFCNTIVFHGPFDDHDRRFLDTMAENTAREVFVKKFLEPNSFLLQEVRELPAVELRRYSQAELVFDKDSTTRPSSRGRATSRAESWGQQADRIAVLSSGGKESLLSDSLLREMGHDVHAIFVNESGKHWFTALNAYRHFAAHVSNTARVWTNSDRLFSWMLRHLPFIRQNFDRMRADEYPIRLWTVAVFLFGALPILRKRGISRLVIGDEYDTTDKKTHRGITHYNGLYDQSRFFDQAMTRYFHRKGWRVSQFSILRPLSEFLVEKVLVDRYPEVQRLQMSCHATHISSETGKSGPKRSSVGSAPHEQDASERFALEVSADSSSAVRPCGRCEKCTRVVGMLTSLGADATACGYSREQIDRCLANLLKSGAMLEDVALEHMAHLLSLRGLLPSGSIAGRIKPHGRSEVTKLRFHSVRSPVDDIPLDLREPLYRILLQHAAGAVQRSGRIWIKCDPLDDSALKRPYPFENVTPPSKARSATQSAAQQVKRPASTDSPEVRAASRQTICAKRRYLWGELTQPEAAEQLRHTDVALLPVGAIEQHGHHLPLDTDSYDADCLCRAVAERCSDPKPLVLPLIPYGVSYHHEDFTGTISVHPETLSRLVHEVGVNVARQGITKLVIVNGHGGNAPALHFAAQMINRDAHILTCVDSGETSDADVEALVETAGDVHAGEIETSTSLANRPGLVQMDKAKRFVPKFSSHYLDFASKRRVDWYARTAKISRSGILGDATKASREKGEKMWDLMVGHLTSFVEDLKSMSLDEIHQKTRY